MDTKYPLDVSFGHPFWQYMLPASTYNLYPPMLSLYLSPPMLSPLLDLCHVLDYTTNHEFHNNNSDGLFIDLTLQPFDL